MSFHLLNEICASELVCCYSGFNDLDLLSPKATISGGDCLNTFIKTLLCRKSWGASIYVSVFIFVAYKIVCPNQLNTNLEYKNSYNHPIKSWEKAQFYLWVESIAQLIYKHFFWIRAMFLKPAWKGWSYKTIVGFMVVFWFIQKLLYSYRRKKAQAPCLIL